jgi:Flp pilus assembly protein TadG
MSNRIPAYLRNQRSQSMTEFALVAPVLLLVLFGILDFGRAVYYFITIDQAVNEGARVAIRAPTPPNPDFYAPSNDQVVTVVKSQAPALLLAKPACMNGLASGSFDASKPAANTGYIYVTAPGGQAPAGTAPSYAPANAPGGEPAAAPTGSCARVVPAGITPGQTNVPLQVTIRFNFVPVTPFIGQYIAASSPLILTGYASYRTEY